jgi:hypothetical protein
VRLHCLPLLLAVCLSCAPDSASDQSKQRAWPKLETLAKLEDKRIDESSGIAASRIAEGIYYTHNDSGDSARFFKFNHDGKVLGVYDLTNAESAVDWEDMASATVGGKPYLYFGDIGDNQGIRKEIYVYRCPESAPTTADRIYTLSYPDEPHNAETLMVRPETGDIYIVTKAANKPSLVFKLSNPGRSGRYVLEKVGEIKVESPIREGRLITGGDIAPDGKHVVLRTYMAAYEYGVPDRFDDWIKAAPLPIHTNLEFQGEGVCYSRDGQALLTTSEGTPCQVSESRLPKR